MQDQVKKLVELVEVQMLCVVAAAIIHIRRKNIINARIGKVTGVCELFKKCAEFALLKIRCHTHVYSHKPGDSCANRPACPGSDASAESTAAGLCGCG